MEDLTQKLLRIQQKLKAPKNERNTFANFDYRSAEKILEAVKPLVHAEGLILVLSDESKQTGDWNYIVSTAELGDGKSIIRVSAEAREQEIKKGMDAAQITGAASSYARKYALSGLFAIDDSSDDPDSKDNKVVTKPKKTIDPLAKAKDELNKMLEEYNHDNDVKKKLVINKVLNKRSVDTVQEAEEVMQYLTDRGM